MPEHTCDSGLEVQRCYYQGIAYERLIPTYPAFPVIQKEDDVLGSDLRMEARDMHERHPNEDKPGIVYAKDTRALAVMYTPPNDRTGVSAADFSSAESQSE